MTAFSAQRLCPSELHVETVVLDGCATVRLVGEVDLSNAARLGEAIQHLQHSGALTIVVDMAGLAFIDSRGLHELVLALQRQRQCNGDVVLRAPRPSTRRVLEIVGLSELFMII